jgi:hypothetical protein
MSPATDHRNPDKYLSRRRGTCVSTVILTLALICASADVSANEDDLRASRSPKSSVASMTFGIKTGVSFGQHYGTEERDSQYEVSSDWRESFAAGAFLGFRVTDRFSLQQELLYVRKGSSQDIGVDILEIPTVLDVTYDMDYIEIPVLLKFTWLRLDQFDLRSLSGFALSLKVHDKYRLRGELDDGTQVVPLRADADMSEVDMFDYSFVYGTELEFNVGNTRLAIEHRYTIGTNKLLMPTYTYVPFEDDQILIDNEPVPLRNQNHLLLLGIRF